MEWDPELHVKLFPKQKQNTKPSESELQLPTNKKLTITSSSQQKKDKLNPKLIHSSGAKKNNGG